MKIRLKRVYDEPSADDGYRVLVDKLWPRGISKDDARIDEWIKEIAPPSNLRKWYHNNPTEWDAFRKEYMSILKNHSEKLRPLASKARNTTVTLLYGSRNKDRNNATVVKQYLNMLDPEK